jgi:hypothetical protein
MRPIQTGSANVTLLATAYNADGSVKTDLAFDPAGISIYVQKIGAADGSPMSLSAKATPATAHNDGAFLNLGGGDISVDIPDAPLSGYLGKIRIYGTFTGGFIVGSWYPVVGFNPDVAAVGANTVTPPTLAEMTARTLPAADYFDPVSHPVNVNRVAGTTVAGPNDLKADVSGIPASVWSFGSRVLTAFGFTVALQADQAVNVTKVGGTTVSGPDDLKANVSGLAQQTTLVALGELTEDVWSGVSTLLTRIPATLFAGITSIGKWLGLIAGKTPDAPTLAELNATTAGATFSNLTDSLEASADNPADVDIDEAALASAIADALQSSGQYRLTVSAVEGDDAVSGVRLQIVGVAGTSRTTGSSGEAMIDLDAGTYLLRVTSPQGYAAVDDVDVTIVDDDVAVEIELTPSSIAAPTDPAVCSVAVDLVTQAGGLPSEVPVWALPYESGQTSGDSWVVDDDETYPTSAEGRAVVPMLRGMRVRIYCTFRGKTYSRGFTVPDSPTAIATLRVG